MKERYYGDAGTGEGEVAAQGIGGAEWNSRRWRRWVRVVFAPWVKGTGEREKGVEFEVWSGGVRAVSGAAVRSTVSKISVDAGAGPADDSDNVRIG